MSLCESVLGNLVDQCISSRNELCAFIFQKTFKYTELNRWENKEQFNIRASKTGLDEEETKTSAFGDTPLNKLCLGMKYEGVTRWIGIDVKGSSLYDVMKGGERETNLGEDKWKSLLSGHSPSLNENADCLK